MKFYEIKANYANRAPGPKDSYGDIRARNQEKKRKLADQIKYFCVFVEFICFYLRFLDCWLFPARAGLILGS